METGVVVAGALMDAVAAVVVGTLLDVVALAYSAVHAVHSALPKCSPPPARPCAISR